MKEYIEREALYKKFSRLEEQAVQNLLKIDPKKEPSEWEKWNCIANERGAYKHDVMDEPAADVREVVRGEWEALEWGFKYLRCTSCGYEHRFIKFKFCPNCGADMRGENDG